jgi:hypothetical protein
LALLDAIDARWNGGREVYPGEIFSALLFAAVAPAMGWTLDKNTAARRDGPDGRTLVDDALRPIALRLRIARKDQEHTRQTLTTLQRMVPLKPMRRGGKLALMRRPAFGDAMAMLDALAPVLGGEFAAARIAWAETVAGHGAAAAPGAVETVEASDADGAPAPVEGGRGKRRRGRRGGRGRRKDRAGDIAAAPAPAGMPASAPAPSRTPAAPAAAARGPKLPPVWDDNYFFAALPSVPTQAGSDDEEDSGRYGGGVVPAAEMTETTSDVQPSPAGRKRRRGGRRQRGGGPVVPPSGSSSPSEGDAS